MIVSRVPAVASCLQPTELQTDSRKWISRVSNSHRLLNRTTIIIGTVGFFLCFFLCHRLEGIAYDNSHIPIEMTYTNPPLFKRRAVGFFSLLHFLSTDLWFCIWSRVHLYRKATIYKPSFLKRGSAIKKRSWEAPFFSRIQVVLVLGWRLEL